MAGAPALRSANRLRIGLAFQNPTMLPWLTIRQNVMVPLKIVQPFRADYAKKKNGEYAERAERCWPRWA
jgi:NitT/TauT family transport system ATP-binding protein